MYKYVYIYTYRYAHVIKHHRRDYMVVISEVFMILLIIMIFHGFHIYVGMSQTWVPQYFDAEY